MSNSHLYCVILAGGVGSRFWPLSREAKPKQFLNFAPGGRTFLRLAYDRMVKILPPENIIVVSLTRYRDLVFESIPELPEDNLILEPYCRNTAPSLAYATYKLLHRDPDAVMIASPADHVITDEGVFTQTLMKAADFAARGHALITMGIVPTSANTNFGYIQMAEPSAAPGTPVMVKTFTEKPDQELAEIFVRSGEFLWNSGIFIWKATAIREELTRHCPDITNLWKDWDRQLDTPGEGVFIEKIYTDCPNISIDYAVMEKSDRAWVFPSQFGWADIGSWRSLYEWTDARDEDGNVLFTGDVSVIRDSRRCVVYCSDKKKLIAIKGLEDLLVIDTGDVLMVCPRNVGAVKYLMNETSMPEFEKYK